MVETLDKNRRRCTHADAEESAAVFAATHGGAIVHRWFSGAGARPVYETTEITGDLAACSCGNLCVPVQGAHTCMAGAANLSLWQDKSNVPPSLAQPTQ
jgi:hypothetical protein